MNRREWRIRGPDPSRPAVKTEISNDSSHVCGNVTWAYTINLDVVLAPFITKRFRQLPKRSFRRGVRRDCEATLEGHEGAKVDYFSSA